VFASALCIKGLIFKKKYKEGQANTIVEKRRGEFKKIREKASGLLQPF